MNKIKIGVLGCSNIARKSVLPAIKKCDKLELVYVAAREINKARDFAEEFDCSACSYDELLTSEKVDCIYVSLPVSLHFKWGMEVLKNNKHLLLEKPFTSTIEQTTELIEYAKKNNLIAMEGLMYLYHPLLKKVKELVKSGSIGEIRNIDAKFAFPRLASTDIRSNPKLGGGAILDNLIYPLSLCLEFGEEISEINSIIRYDSEFKTDKSGNILIKFSDFTGNITYGFDYMYNNSYQIWGTKGIIKVDRAFSRPADFSNNIIIQKQDGVEEYKVDAEDQFCEMLYCFCGFIENKDEYYSNLSKFLMRSEIISNIYINSQKENPYVK